MINEGVIDPFFTHPTLSFDSTKQSHTQLGAYIVCVNTNWKFCCVSGVVCAQFGGDIVCEHNSENTMRTHTWIYLLGSF
jgi:hypothetical protein